MVTNIRINDNDYAVQAEDSDMPPTKTELFSLSSSYINNTSFIMGHLKIPPAASTVVTRTLPSCPGWTAVIFPIGYCSLNLNSCLIRRISPIAKLR